MNNRNVLVIGGAGFIGAQTVLALREAGFRPVVYDNFSTGHRDAVFAPDLVEGELADRDLLARTFARFEIGSVIHFAALIEAGESVRAPLRFYRNNVAATVALLEAMQAGNVGNIVFSSTAAVYGERAGDGRLAETLACRPANPYGDTKAAVEAMLRNLARAGAIRAIALRYFNAAGADPAGRCGERHEPETHLIPLVLQAAAGRRARITVFGSDYPTPDGTCIRDYIHVHDLARGHVAALEHLLAGPGEGGEGAPGPAFQAINLGSGQGHSVRQVIETCKAVTGVDFAVVQAGRRAGDPARLVADPGLAARVLNWRAERSDLERIVGDAWRFFSR